jgi:hypothetical protein
MTAVFSVAWTANKVFNGSSSAGFLSPVIAHEREGKSMKKMTFLLLFLVCGLSCREISYSDEARYTDVSKVAKQFNFFITLEGGEGEEDRFLYADTRQHVHIYVIKKGKPVLEWETTNLGSRVTSVFVRDLDHDGNEELVIATTGGRILMYDAKEYDLLWENLQDPFEKISCMTAENLDQDPQDELVFIADSFLYIYDSINKSLEWQSQEKFDAAEILLANLDDDEQPEIILNTGAIIDSRFYNLEFQVEGRFGNRISLMDLNGDGVPEIIGENTDFTLRIYDVYAEREIW